MSKRLMSFASAILFNLICISLISSVMLFRADVIRAQDGTGNDDDVALVPRSVEVAEGEDEEDDDNGDADPPTDNDGVDTPPGEEEDVIVYTIRPGDTLWKLAARLGVPYAVLRAQDDTPSVIHPGQKFTYRPSDRIDSSIPLTDDDGTDSDGYDTPPPTTDFDGISTPPSISNDGMDSDGYDTPVPGGSGATGANAQHANQQQQQVHTDNDGTDSDGIATSQLTDNDGTDSDGIATSQLTDNDGTDSDGVATSQLSTNNPSPDSPVSVDSSVST